MRVVNGEMTYNQEDMKVAIVGHTVYGKNTFIGRFIADTVYLAEVK